MPPDVVEEAKTVVQTHEDYARMGDLDRVMTNVAEDIVLLAANAPLVKGAKSFRDFYGDLLGMGTWDFTHDYHGAEAVGDLVVLHGVALGTLSPTEGSSSEFRNNFVHVLRRGQDGRLRIWRAAFAPASPSS